MHGPEFWDYWKPNKGRGRLGCKYIPQEDSDIMEQMDAGKPITEIADYHKRSVKAIELRVQHITAQLTKKLVGEQKIDAADAGWSPSPAWKTAQMRFIMLNSPQPMKFFNRVPKP